MERSGEDVDDLGLQIPLSSLLGQFDCPICYEQVKSCMITPCGHNFCRACIAECLNRKHQCPLCNKECLIGQCHPNLHFDNILKTIMMEKDSASKKYFEALFKKSGDHPTPQQHQQVENDSGGGAKAPFSPVESLFQKHMKRSLAEFTQYSNLLASRREHALQQIRDLYIDKMGRAKSAVDAQNGGKANKGQLDAALAPLETEMNIAMGNVRDSFDQSMSALLEAYDEHMGKAAPSMAALPVSVTVVVDASKTVVDSVIIKPTETARELRATIMERLAGLGNPVVSQNERCLFRLQRACDVSSQLQIVDEVTPLGMLKIEPASKIFWTGDVKLKSDVPALCFSVTYVKDAKQAVDYYSCKQCGINWICSSCAKHCHPGHEVKMYLKAHVPTWACCYCAKKTKCQLLAK